MGEMWGYFNVWVLLLFLDQYSVAFSIESEGAVGAEGDVALRNAISDGAAVEPLAVFTCIDTANCCCCAGGAKVEDYENCVVAAGLGVGKYVAVVAVEECGSGAVGKSWLSVSQCHEGCDGVLHLGVGRIPVDFCVVEVVEDLVIAHFLSVIEQRHAIDGEEECG